MLPPPAARQTRDGELGRGQQPGEVGPGQRLPAAGVGLLERLAEGAADDVDEDVELPVGGVHGVEERAERLGVAAVERLGVDRHPVGRELLAQRGQPVGVPVGDGQAHPGAPELERARPAEPTRAAEQDRDAAGDVESVIQVAHGTSREWSMSSEPRPPCLAVPPGHQLAPITTRRAVCAQLARGTFPARERETEGNDDERSLRPDGQGRRRDRRQPRHRPGGGVRAGRGRCRRRDRQPQARGVRAGRDRDPRARPGAERFRSPATSGGGTTATAWSNRSTSSSAAATC